MTQVDSIRPPNVLHDRRAPQTGFRPDVEGLRAVAVLGVVLFHAVVPGVGGGFVGVDVFFAISGFLITGMLWEEATTTGTVRLRRFYGGRARRLLPASALVGVATMIGAAILLPSLQIRSAVCDGIASALYVGNYRFALQGIDYFAANRPPSPFQHYWSLGVEEQFYLLWPPMIIGVAWLIRHMRRHNPIHAKSSMRPYLTLLALITAASFAVSLVATRLAPPVAFFSLPTRAWQLAAGGLVALTAVRWGQLPRFMSAIAGWIGLAAILLAYNKLGSTTPYPGTAALLPLVGTVLILGAGCATPCRGVGRILAWAPMRAIGRLSYSWYLWHWPVLIFIPALLDRPMGLADRLAAVAISGGLAMLTLHLVENPLRYAGALRRSPRRSLAVGGLSTAIAVCVGLVLLAVIPAPVGRSLAAQALTITAGPPLVGVTIEQYNETVQRLSAQVQIAVAASADLPDVPSNLEPALADAAGEVDRIYFGGCLRNFLELGQPECAMSDTSSPTTVALVGDSNAAMWTLGFQRVAAQRHWRLEMLAKGLCPLQDLPTLLQNRPYTECDQWRAEVMARLSAERPKLVVVSMLRRYGTPELPESFSSYDPAWNAGMTRLVQQLRDSGAKVLVLGPIPDPQSKTPDCLASHLDDATACSPQRSLAVNDAGIARESASVKAGGGSYADITDLFCTADRCPVIVGNSLVYFDRMHATLEYAQLLAPVLGALADRALMHG